MSVPERQSRFRELLERNHARWVGIARAYAAPCDVDDLVQEIALQVWQSLDRFSGRSSLDTWAYRVAINTALAWKRSVRSRERRIEKSRIDVAELSGNLGAENAEQRILYEFLSSLSDVDRAAMLLYLDNVPSTEAAEILGLTDGALRVRMHRIRKQFEAAYCQKVETK